MPRSRNVTPLVLALTVGGVVVAACDTDDGRDMKPPTPYQEFVLASTTPTTVTTTAPFPTGLVPGVAPDSGVGSPSTSGSESTAGSQSKSTSPGSYGADSAGAAPADSTALTGDPASSEPGASDPVGSDQAGSDPAPGEPGGAPADAADGSDGSGGTPAAGSATTVPDAAVTDDTFAETLGLANLADIEFSAPWAPATAINVEFTCDGADQAPLLTWTSPPEGTAEMALVVTDESSDPSGFVHWAVIDLPPEAGSFGGTEPAMVGVAALNSFGQAAWGGPCPPDPASHTYRFALYALEAELTVAEDAATPDVLAAIDAAATGVASFTATYGRAG